MFFSVYEPQDIDLDTFACNVVKSILNNQLIMCCVCLFHELICF